MYFIILFFLITIVVYFIILLCRREKIVFNKNNSGNIFFTSGVTKCIEEIYNRKIINGKIKKFTITKVLIVCILLFVISIIFLYFILGVLSTAVILSCPILISPLILSKLLISVNKRKIVRQLPMYAINIKNYMTEENNIVAAIMKANVEQPLAQFIERFKNNVSRGMNVLKAFEMLKNEVAVKEFSDLIYAFELCYRNGGKFVSVIEKYILIITKEVSFKEGNEEKALSSILTLLIMLILNIVVILLFVLKNAEYAQIIRGTFIGEMILNFNAISYMIIAGLVCKIYKEE